MVILYQTYWNIIIAISAITRKGKTDTFWQKDGMTQPMQIIYLSCSPCWVLEVWGWIKCLATNSPCHPSFLVSLYVENSALSRKYLLSPVNKKILIYHQSLIHTDISIQSYLSHSEMLTAVHYIGKVKICENCKQLIHITIYTAKGYKIPLIWQLLGRTKINITNLLFEIFGEIQNCHPQGFTSGRKPRQCGGKKMQISKDSHIECEIHALDSLKFPVGKPSPNAFSNQCRGFPVLLHVQNQLSVIWGHEAEGRSQELKVQNPSSCVTGVSLGYTLAHTQPLKCQRRRVYLRALGAQVRASQASQ